MSCQVQLTSAEQVHITRTLIRVCKMSDLMNGTVHTAHKLYIHHREPLRALMAKRPSTAIIQHMRTRM